MKKMDIAAVHYSPILILLTVLASGCAGNVAQQTMEGGDSEYVSLRNLPGWSVQPSLSGNSANSWIYCIEKISGSWKYAPACELQKANVEALHFDPDTKSVYLIALAPSVAELPPSEQQRIGHSGYHRSSTQWTCLYGTFGIGFRKPDRYSVCSSNFLRGVTSGGIIASNVVGAVLAFGTIRRDVAISQNTIAKAINEADLAPKLMARIRERYQDEFQKAITSSDFRAFIYKYEKNDPDGLIPRAKEALYQAELKEAADTEKRRRELVRRSIELKNEQERQRQMLVRWRNGLKEGEACWVGPFEVGATNTMLSALVVERRGNIVLVQYNGTTNTPYRVVRKSPTEWVKLSTVYPENQFKPKLPVYTVTTKW